MEDYNKACTKAYIKAYDEAYIKAISTTSTAAIN
jgi:hypothetical protein